MFVEVVEVPKSKKEVSIKKRKSPEGLPLIVMIVLVEVVVVIVVIAAVVVNGRGCGSSW